MKGIMPCLWFDNEAEKAAKFYTSVFKDGKIGRIERYGKVGPGKPGSVMTIIITLQGQEYLLLNGGPVFKFNEAVSFVVYCKDQKEVDYYWEKLSKGGKKVQCGWLTDQFGLSWQVTPKILPDLLARGDEEASQRMFKAMMEMVKLDVAKLKAAYEGK